MPLAAPTNLFAQIQSQHSAHLTWTNGAVYDEVQWEKRVAGGSWYDGGSYGWNATEAQDDGLEDGTEYEWHVRGWTSAGEGEYSDWSAGASGITPLHDPDGMSGTCLSSTSIHVWWNDNAQNEANYILQRAVGYYGSFSDYQTLGANVNDYIDSGLTPGQWYRYRVYAKNSKTQSNVSNDVPLWTADPPNAPSGLQGQATGTTTAHLSFQDNSYNETSFRIMIYPPGGPWSEWGYVGANVTQATITGLTSNTAYGFKVKARGDSGDSADSNQVDIVTFAAIAQPTNLTVTVLSGTKVFLRFQDNSELEDDHRVEEKVGAGAFTEIATLPANVFGYRRTGLTAGSTYTYRVRAKQGAVYSSYSSEVQVTTMTVPSLVAGFRLNRQPIGDPNFENWTDVSTLLFWTKTLFGSSTLNRSTTPIRGTYAGRINLVVGSPNDAYINQPFSLRPGVKYYFEIWLTSDSADKYAKVQLRTNDNKFYLGSDGVWTEISSDVFNCNSAVYTKNSISFEPMPGYTEFNLFIGSWGQPTKSGDLLFDDLFLQALDARDYLPDIEMRLEWLPADGAVGYKIEKSTNGTDFTEIAKVDVPEYLATGLAPGTEYWWRARGYNAQGDGNYCNIQAEVTETTYERTPLELALRNPRSRLCYLAEANPLIELSGFTLVSGKTYTYQITFGEDGAQIDAVYENGAAYGKKTTMGGVEGVASTYCWDYYNGILYIHTSTGTNPVNFQILASFWLSFTSWKTKDAPAAWGEKNYLGLLKQEEIPDITSEVTPYYESSSTGSFGTLSLMNAKIRGTYYFDRRYKAYCWRGRKVIFKYGIPGAHISEYRPFFTGLISPEENAIACNDKRFTAQLVDLRTNLMKNVPAHRFKTSEFPALPTALVDKGVPRIYGTATDVPAFLIDETNRVYLFNDGRVKQIDAVKQNGTTTLVSGTDYTGLADLGMLVIHKMASWVVADQITVDFVGVVNAADEKIELDADIFKHFCKAEFAMTDAEFENDSVARTRNAKTQALKLVIGQDFNSDDILRTLEHSINGYIFQDGNGRLGIKVAETAARSDAPRIRDHQIHDYSQTAGPVFLGVNVYYDQNPKDGEWKVETKIISTNAWKARAQKMLDILTALASQGDAAAMGTEIIALLDKDFPGMEVAGLLMQINAGDVVPYTRTRAYNLSGTANEALLRVYSITKSIAGKRTRIRGEIVA